MNQRYSALRIYASILKFLGWAIIIVGVIASLAVMGKLGLVQGVVPLVGAGLLGLGAIAFGELMYVAMDIEENTRRSAESRGVMALAQTHITHAAQARETDEKNYRTTQRTVGNSATEEEPSKENVTPLDAPSMPDDRTKSFENARIEATKRVSSKGFVVETIGTYPNIRWKIKSGARVVKSFDSLEEFVNFSQSI